MLRKARRLAWEQSHPNTGPERGAGPFGFSRPQQRAQLRREGEHTALAVLGAVRVEAHSPAAMSQCDRRSVSRGERHRAFELSTLMSKSRTSNCNRRRLLCPIEDESRCSPDYLARRVMTARPAETARRAGWPTDAKPQPARPRGDAVPHPEPPLRRPEHIRASARPTTQDPSRSDRHGRRWPGAATCSRSTSATCGDQGTRS